MASSSQDKERLTKEGEARDAKTALKFQLETSFDREIPHGVISKPQEGKALPVDTLATFKGPNRVNSMPTMGAPSLCSLFG